MAKKLTKNEHVESIKQSIPEESLALKKFLWIVLISFLGVAIYFKTYNYKYSADDGIYSYFNSATSQGLDKVGDFFKYGSLKFINIDATNSGTYRPLTLLSFGLEKQIVGAFNPSYSHTINIVLYFFLLVAIGLVLVQLFHYKKVPILVPLLILLVYAAHPLHVEVVASVKSRDTLLCSLFSIVAIYFWLKNNQTSSFWIKLAYGILFFLSLLSKEESLTLIPVVFLMSWYFLNENFIKSIKNTIPFAIAAVVYLTIRQIILDPPTANYNNIINNVVFAAQGQEHLATNLYIYIYYIKLLILPYPLSWDYSFNQISIKTITDGWVLFSFVFFLGLLYLAFKGFKKRTIFSFGILFYLCTFSIYSNFFASITIGSTLAERFMFVPSLGFCIILVYGLYAVLVQFKSNKTLPLLFSIGFLIAVVYSLNSHNRIPVWKDNLSLLYSGVKTSPKSWRTHIMLADELRQQAVALAKDTVLAKTIKDSSQQMFKKAVSEYNKGYAILDNNAKVSSFLQGLGECYIHLKDTASAKATFLKSNNPKLFYSLFKLGMISFYEKDYQAAVKYYQKALQADMPDYFSTYKNLATSYLMLKEDKNAIDAFKNALEYGKSDEINAKLAFLYTRIGDKDKAKTYLIKNSAIPVDNSNFYQTMTLGNTAYSQNNYAKAIAFFEKCYPDFDKMGGVAKYPDYLNTYAHALLQTNNFLRAKTIFKQLVNSSPKNYFALKNLGFIAFQYEKNYPQAIQYYNQSLQANAPDYFQSYSNLGTIYLIQNQTNLAIQNYELSLKYGSSSTIISNLYLLWKSKGNQEKMEYYQALMKQ